MYSLHCWWCCIHIHCKKSETGNYLENSWPRSSSTKMSTLIDTCVFPAACNSNIKGFLGKFCRVKIMYLTFVFVLVMILFFSCIFRSCLYEGRQNGRLLCNPGHSEKCYRGWNQKGVSTLWKLKYLLYDCLSYGTELSTHCEMYSGT